MGETYILFYEKSKISIRGINHLIGLMDRFKVGLISPSILEELDSVLYDLILIDINQFGLEAVTRLLYQIRDAGVKMPVIVWGEDIPDYLAVEAVCAGVSGVISKSTLADSMKECLEKVSGGSKWIDPSVIDIPSQEGRLDRLNTREREVYKLILIGRKNREIAEELNLAVGTIKIYVSRIFDKMGVRRRDDLILQSML